MTLLQVHSTRYPYSSNLHTSGVQRIPTPATTRRTADHPANQHLNLAGLVGFHPLRGPNADDFGVRFPPLSDAYDLELRRRVHRAWKELGLDHQKRRLHEGVYAFVAGPR